MLSGSGASQMALIPSHSPAGPLYLLVHDMERTSTSQFTFAGRASRGRMRTDEMQRSLMAAQTWYRIQRAAPCYTTI